MEDPCFSNVRKSSPLQKTQFMAKCEQNIKISDLIPLSKFDESVGVLDCENHWIIYTNEHSSDIRCLDYKFT